MFTFAKLINHNTMKNYFNFLLEGKRLFLIWLLFLAFFVLPYVLITLNMKDLSPEVGSSIMILLAFLLLILISFVFVFYITKLMIEGLQYKDKTLVFSGSFGKYLGVILLGYFLSIITLGIYMAWFIKNIYKYFINNTSYDGQNLQFNAKGAKLFLLILLLVFIPMLILSVLMYFVFPDFASGNITGQLITGQVLINQIVVLLIMIPYSYLFYKWLINIDYKDMKISWETEFWPSCGKIALEILLSLITAGIYYPLAIVRLYKYFAEKTRIKGENRELKFAYDIDHGRDFLYLWGQILLTIITAGLYYPWALCKIYKRILSKTYSEEELPKQEFARI